MPTTLSTQTLQASWETFLNDYYKDQIEEIALNYPEQKSIVIDWAHIDLRDPALAEHLLEHPLSSITAAEDALKLIEVPVEPRPHLHVRVKNLAKTNHHDVRKLRAEHLGRFVAVNGIIKKVVEVRPKLQDATFLCRRCGAVFRVAQEEQVLVEPDVCPEEQGGCGESGAFKLVAEESRFIDSQKIEIQENPEELRGGAQPERLTVYLEDDIVGHVAPGDRVILNGIFRAQQRRQGSLKLAEFLKVMDCISIEVQQLDFEEVEITPEDVVEIEEIAKSPDVYKVLRDSFAPEILGLEEVKDAMIMSLFSGVAKEYKDGTRLRGDIHLLLVGDPGVAKCVRGDTRVTLATGERRPIRDLVDEAMAGEPMAVDDGWWAPLRVPVFSMDARGRVVTRWTSRAWKRTAAQRMVRITTRSGRTIEVTPTHPLFMTDGVVIHPREAGRLRVGDHVAVPRRLPEVVPSPRRIEDVEYVKSRAPWNAVRLRRPAMGDAAFWHLVGLLLGDGNVSYRPEKGRWWVELTTETPELKAFFEEQAERLGARPGGAPKAGSPAWHLWATGVEPSSFLSNLGLSGTARQKAVPPLAFQADRASKIAFLSGLFDADAHVSVTRSVVQYDSASRELASGVQDLLNELGVVSFLRKNIVPRRNDPYWRVVVAGEHAATLCGLLRPLHPGKAAAVKALANRQTRCNSNVDVVPVNAQFLRDLRQGLGLSQSACGVARGTWVGLERGEKRPTRGTFTRLVERFAEVAVDGDGYTEAAARMATLATADIFWDEIVSYAEVRPEEPFVYDLEVPGTHNFVANGIINHNSQLLRYLSKLSPRSVYTSGKGASSAGLTASAVRDEFSEGQWSLEAGALVLADQGVALIDELDKMDEHDSSAMHQAMEQQEISISKAGINATLRSRCAVVAAANPKLGRFDEFKSISQQIDLPLPLITRFDLIFAIKDKPERGIDERLAAHILMTHRAGEVHEYRKRRPDNGWTQQQEDALFVRLNPTIEERMMRKYIAHARRSIFPVLDDDAVRRIQEFYVDLRNRDDTDSIPFTPRALEAIVRITEASARARLSGRATIDDAERSLRIFQTYLRGVGTDWETGVLDYDLIATGASHTQQDRMRKILEIIRGLASESGGSAAEADILREAASVNIQEDKVRLSLENLKQRGQIYSPSNGKYAAV